MTVSLSVNDLAANDRVADSLGAAPSAGPAQIPAAGGRSHLLRYLLIGATASAIDVALFALLYNVAGTSALAAHSVAVPAAVLFSFFVNARHNFHTSDHMVLRLISFVLVCTIGYLAGFGVIALVEMAGWGANIGKIASLPVVFVIQFVLNSRITFRKAAPRG